VIIVIFRLDEKQQQFLNKSEIIFKIKFWNRIQYSFINFSSRFRLLFKAYRRRVLKITNQP